MNLVQILFKQENNGCSALEILLIIENLELNIKW